MTALTTVEKLREYVSPITNTLKRGSRNPFDGYSEFRDLEFEYDKITEKIEKFLLNWDPKSFRNLLHFPEFCNKFQPPLSKSIVCMAAFTCLFYESIHQENLQIFFQSYVRKICAIQDVSRLGFSFLVDKP